MKAYLIDFSAEKVWAFSTSTQAMDMCIKNGMLGRDDAGVIIDPSQIAKMSKVKIRNVVAIYNGIAKAQGLPVRRKFDNKTAAATALLDLCDRFITVWPAPKDPKVKAEKPAKVAKVKAEKAPKKPRKAKSAKTVPAEVEHPTEAVVEPSPVPAPEPEATPPDLEKKRLVVGQGTRGRSCIYAGHRITATPYALEENFRRYDSVGWHLMEFVRAAGTKGVTFEEYSEFAHGKTGATGPTIHLQWDVKHGNVTISKDA